MTDTPSIQRRILGCAAAFVAMNVVGTGIAMVMGPFVGPQFGTLLRDPAGAGLNFPALLCGYAVVAMALTVLHGRSASKELGPSALLGLCLGLAVFLGDHLITSGWSVMPAGTMAVSGLFDSLAVVAGAVVLSWVTMPRTNSTHANAH